MGKLDQACVIARKIKAEKKCDVFLYNGEIARFFDLAFIDLIEKHKSQPEALLFLITTGGDADAGYKISRHLQNTYDRHAVVISGECKSAGTLIAVGAHELAFDPSYGELGPLDVQTVKKDDLAGRMSGLTIQEALDALTRDAIIKHGGVFSAIIRDTNAVVSIPTAAKAAAELIVGLYSPIFAQIDPLDVGDKARAMRIATDYGKRLSAHTKNLNEKTLATITRTYPSHSFVIDFWEARELFRSVRVATENEKLIISSLGSLARAEVDGDGPASICLSKEPESDESEPQRPANGGRGPDANPPNPRRAGGKGGSSAASERSSAPKRKRASK